MHPRTPVTAALVLVVLASGAACPSPQAHLGDGPCVPRIEVSPVRAVPGGTVTISSEDTCDTAPPTDGWKVGAGRGGDGDPLSSVTTTETFDGSFQVELTLPTEFPLGEACAAVTNWDLGDCDDTGSCAGPSSTFQVVE
jgi:hypothetical protein